MSPEEIQAVLADHALWLTDIAMGQRADLRGADLSRADLTGADLTEARLSRTEVTDNEILTIAAEAFERRDRVAAELRLIDDEIEQLTRCYGQTMKVWGWTPLMLRRAIAAM